jgi:hypothetical protein
MTRREVEREAVLIFPRPGETANDLCAVMSLIGFEAETSMCYDVEET